MKVGNCKACKDLKETSIETARKGIQDKQCKSLQNDTGLNPDLAVLHNDCEDLNNLNDCLIESFSEEIETYDDCDWKEYEKDQNSNIHTVIKAVICAVCGLWSNIHKIWDKLENLQNQINQIQKSITVNGKIEVARNVSVVGNEYLIKPVDLGNVSNDTRVTINWRAGSTRRTDSYTVGDLRGDNAHIYGANMIDSYNSEDSFEVFTKIKPNTNSLWITTTHRKNINANGNVIWNAEPFLGNHTYYDDQDPRYAKTNEGNPYHAIIVERVTVYDLVDPIIIEK